MEEEARERGELWGKRHLFLQGVWGLRHRASRRTRSQSKVRGAHIKPPLLYLSLELP